MRKTLYYTTFAAVSAILALNIISILRPDWLVVQYNEILYTKITVTYGITERCELTVSKLPGSSPDDGEVTYRKYECRGFPNRVKDGCEKENKAFCAAWITAGYLDELAIGFAAVSLVAILFGVSTHSRRRRIWRAVAGLVLLMAISQITTFGIITDVYRTSNYPSFDRARPGVAYVLHTVSWIASILTALGIILTGISADAGHRWAAGNRAYHPILP
ncbi:hypothetical protein BDN70DRAFT_908611 [Pholiota conissans]|uniref:Uncharacterized protein n=1 Tax=Pholiota conissans TaxID=109636 RepID=A0A9P5YUN5_9AGAR|nr:hypothetical protein BDN70DRAFT_908611 [Pholiota conissans]